MTLDGGGAGDETIDTVHCKPRGFLQRAAAVILVEQALRPLRPLPGRDMYTLQRKVTFERGLVYLAHFNITALYAPRR